jgi:hypothetical protein
VDATKNARNVSKISFWMISKGWRPTLADYVELGMPSKIPAMIDFCLIENLYERPSFKDIVEFIRDDVRPEVLGLTGTGTGTTEGTGSGGISGSRSRRASLSGALHHRIKQSERGRRMSQPVGEGAGVAACAECGMPCLGCKQRLAAKAAE